jgi:cytoplasmic iron level regulating protein YaaA (DUF328/UPF0246 family)
MSELLVQGCSKTKEDVSGAVPAFELYSGYYYKIIKKAIREGEYKEEMDICIISAEYGLLNRDDEIETYNRKMNTERAKEIRTEIVPELQEKISGRDYQRVILNLGEEYRRAVEGFQSDTDIEVIEIEGGLGERGHELKKIIRSEEEELQR